MNDEKIKELFNTVFKEESKKNISNSSSNSETNTISQSSDGSFENNIRELLLQRLPIKKNDEIIEEGKPFIIFSMEIFDKKEKKLLKSKSFFQEEFYCIEIEEEVFIIRRDDLSKLYYYNSKTKNKSMIQGFEETQPISKESENFYFTEEEENKIMENEQKENKEKFFNDIKFNLISNETISFIEENNNIPDNILKGYNIKGKLLLKGNNLFALGFGNDKEYKIGEGTIHYPMKDYYKKLTTIKGEFDGIYTNMKTFKLAILKCNIIYSQFDTIYENSKILFEFKNSGGGKNKVIKQAINYQKNANIIFKDNVYYHFIIVRSKELANALKKKIKDEFIKKNNFINFALLCIDDKLDSFAQFSKSEKEKVKDNPEESFYNKMEKIEIQISTLQQDNQEIKNDIKSLK